MEQVDLSLVLLWTSKFHPEANKLYSKDHPLKHPYWLLEGTMDVSTVGNRDTWQEIAQLLGVTVNLMCFAKTVANKANRAI